MSVKSTLSRRRIIKQGGLLLAAPAVFRAMRASAQANVFEIGLASPTTGPLAGFGEAS